MSETFSDAFRASVAPLQLQGKCFLITGATQGLGEAVARLFVARGAGGVALVGRQRERGEALAAELQGDGVHSVFLQADLMDSEAPARVVAEAVQAFGHLHGIVQCAGATDRGSILDTDADTWHKLFTVNAQAPFFLMQAAARHMVAEGIEGTMVNIGSISAHGGQSFLTPYVASKAALVAMTRNVAFSLMRNRIRANVLNIGWMDSPGEHAIQKACHGAADDWLQQVEPQEPFGRLVKPEEVARCVAYLSSAESGLMTGAALDFDQGVIGCGDGRPPQPPAPAEWPA